MASPVHNPERVRIEAHRATRRMAECPVRRFASCGLVDIRLGVPVSMSMDVCDSCWLSNPMSPDGEAVRNRFLEVTVRGLVARTNIETLPAGVVREAVRVLQPHELEASRNLPKPERADKRGVRTVRWLGIRWRGPAPYPVQVWRWLTRIPRPWGPGCGCAHVPKSIVERVVAAIRRKLDRVARWGTVLIWRVWREWRFEKP